MYRYTEPVIVTLLLPVAVLLLLIGVRALRLKETSGLRLKLAVILNTSLAIILGWVGCAKAENTEGFVTCYIMPMMLDEVIPVEFRQSDGWYDLEKAIVDLEDEISSGEYDLKKSGEIGGRIYEALATLEAEGLMTDNEFEIVEAYCVERLAYNQHVLGGATCYRVALPEGRDALKSEAVDRAVELRGLYANGQVGNEAYEAALSALEENIRAYTGDEDVSTVRQLILDLADGVKYD